MRKERSDRQDMHIMLFLNLAKMLENIRFIGKKSAYQEPTIQLTAMMVAPAE
jgi:hypothetical protein